MNVLILGSGGREHAFAWKISQSNKLDRLFIAPGNAGTATLGTNIGVDPGDFEAVKELVLRENISLVLVGPEAPLVEGIHDFFLGDEKLKTVPVIGPEKEAAMLEGSKHFAKDFMKRHGIPTAAYRSFGKNETSDALDFLKTMIPPYVLKADGLAAGKGVLICDSLDEAYLQVRAILEENKFGEAGDTLVIEEFLNGIELSVFILTDGHSYVILPEAKDYKRIGEADTGLNTGGMGSVSPVPFAGKEFMDRVNDRVIVPTMEGLKKDGLKYKGFIFFGLMNISGDPYVIEYNARMGDPEAESVLPRIESDLLELLEAVGEERLEEREIRIDPRYASAIMLVSGGYPEAYERGKEIRGLEHMEHSILFHAGTKKLDDLVITSGGRVIAVTALAEDLTTSLKNAYEDAGRILFDKVYYRRDLGRDLMKYLP